MNRRTVVLWFVAASILSGRAIFADTTLQVQELRCEYRHDPLGIDTDKPRLSWILESPQRNQRQAAYQILVAVSKQRLSDNEADLWDSGKVVSDQSIHVVYAGTALKSRQRCFWKVRVWDGDGGVSAWSRTAMWTMGLLDRADWGADWIAPPHSTFQAEDSETRPSPLLRKSFSLDGQVRRAMVHVTGQGLYELYLNGQRVGDHILAPEFTLYNKRIQYQTFDVTDLISPGTNVLGAILGTGWYADRFHAAAPPAQRVFAAQPGLILRLDVELDDGRTKCIVSNDSWRSTTESPLRVTSLYGGETYDARLERPGWNTANYDDGDWEQVNVVDFPGTRLVWQRNEPIRVMKELHPITLTEPEPGSHVCDMGQNLAGWCRLKVTGPAGTIVTLRHAERINDDGTLYTKNLNGALQRDRYIKRGDGEEIFEPRFTYHGFRYVEVTGMPRRLDRDTLLVRAFRSAAPEVGTFECSDPSINQLMSNILWSQRSNLHGIPSDCPQRDERAGWMGDMQAFAQTAIFNMDLAAFFSKWIPDMRDSQADDGRYPNYSPHPGEPNRRGAGVPGWGDAGTIVPWRMYQNYGDKRLLEEHFESARRWVDFIHRVNPNLIWEKRRDNDYNDWLNGDTLKLKDWPKTGGAVPNEIFATAFFAHSTRLVSKMATVIGREEEAVRYRDLFEDIKSEFNRRFVKPDGRIEGDTQAGYALALSFDLIAEELRSRVAGHMVASLARHHGHLSTGFQTTHRLMLELTRNGYHDEATRLLHLQGCPSWNFMIQMGATTIWECWDSYVEGREGEQPVSSLNHYAFGAVGEWMWRHIIGINPDEDHPAYKHFVIHPRPGGGLTWARGSYHSIRGPIVSHWRIENDQFHLNVTIPANTTATVILPARGLETVTAGDRPIAAIEGVKFQRIDNDGAVFAVGSGQYQFTSKLP